MPVKGAVGGGLQDSKVDFDFFLLFLIEENVSYLEIFTKWKNIVPIQSYRGFESRKYIQIRYE